MCDEAGTHAETVASIPRPAQGAAVDPIVLEPVDEVMITTLVDNSYDALMADSGAAQRMPFARIRRGRGPAVRRGPGRSPGWSPSTGSPRW